MKSPVLRHRIRAVNQVFPLKLTLIGIAFLFALSLLIRTLENLRRLPQENQWNLIAERLKGPLQPSDPIVINFIKAQKIIDDPVDRHIPYNFANPHEDPSLGQSLIVKRIFENKRNGFFVECGAYDGENRSNTLSLEKDLGWTGLLIEADRSNYEELKKKNRKAWSTLTCLAIHNYPHEAAFILSGSASRVLGAGHWRNFDTSSDPTSNVQCFPLYSLLLALGVTTVDYFSLDVEGSEMDVLATIPFDKIRIQVLSVELTHGLWRKNTSAVMRYFMEKRGYRFVTRLIANNSFANDLIFAHHELSYNAEFPEEVYFYESHVVDQSLKPIL